jgi:hypothetical protein
MSWLVIDDYGEIAHTCMNFVRGHTVCSAAAINDTAARLRAAAVVVSGDAIKRLHTITAVQQQHSVTHTQTLTNLLYTACYTTL